MKVPLTDFEKSLIAKLGSARFPPGTASKRFARDLCAGHIGELSDKGRKFLAYVVYKFRRQYALTVEENTWVEDWRNRELPVATKEPKSEKVTSAPIPAQRSGDLFGCDNVK